MTTVKGTVFSWRCVKWTFWMRGFEFNKQSGQERDFAFCISSCAPFKIRCLRLDIAMSHSSCSCGSLEGSQVKLYFWMPFCQECWMWQACTGPKLKRWTWVILLLQKKMQKKKTMIIPRNWGLTWMTLHLRCCQHHTLSLPSWLEFSSIRFGAPSLKLVLLASKALSASSPVERCSLISVELRWWWHSSICGGERTKKDLQRKKSRQLLWPMPPSVLGVGWFFKTPRRASFRK